MFTDGSRLIRAKGHTGFVFVLVFFVVGSVLSTLRSELLQQEHAFQNCARDFAAAVTSLSSRLTLVDNLGVLQDALRGHNKAKATQVLNRSIYFEENISKLFLVDPSGKVFADNSVDAGGMQLSPANKFSKINWELAALRNVETNSFGEFGVFNNRLERVLYLSKIISRDDRRIGSVTAIFEYGDLLDALRLKYAIPASVAISFRESSLDEQGQLMRIDRALSNFGLGFNAPRGSLVGWAKWSLLKSFGISLMLTLLLYSVVYLVRQKFVLPVGYFTALMDQLNRDPYDRKKLDKIPMPREILSIRPKLDALMQAIAHSSSVDMARQVAHDIRSPLAALNVVLSGVGKLNEETRVLVRHSIARIQDIASNLLEQNRSDESFDQVASQSKDLHLVSSLIDAIVTEKRTQYRERIGIEIVHKQCEASYGIFCELVPSEFKRVISNLITNSVEAVANSGAIVISTDVAEGYARIEVKDNGRGLDKDQIAKIGIRGLSISGNGSGLGLSHAYRTVESWGGRVEFSSELGVGSTVTVWLPVAQSPGWFVGTLNVSSRVVMGVLDDDSSVHQIWERRLSPIGIDMEHFSTGEQLARWLSANPSKPIKFLVDFEIIGSPESGLDLIQKLGIVHQSILVTSRFEEVELRNRCAKIGVPLIPKGLAGFIPIRELEQPDAVLIDNESLVHDAWEYKAKQVGKSVMCFKSSAEFFHFSSILSSDTPVYIDLNLESESGLEVARRIHQASFKTIYLATGASAKKIDLSQLNFLAGVIGKEPPWNSFDDVHAIGIQP